MQGRIHSFESFGTVDGPGVRFVVFFQGCPMRCLYCHNPDTWAIGSGKSYTAKEILERITRNLSFYKTGGLTATGGEPLLQIDFLTELFEGAKAAGIHTCLDTSGILFRRESPETLSKFDRLFAVTDLVMLDIKHIDEEEHRRLTGHSNRAVLDFAAYLREKNIPLRIRHVILPGVTDQAEELARLGTFLASFDNLESIETLPYHTMGKVKYEKLGIDYPLNGTPQCSETDAKSALERIEAARIAASVF